MADPVELRDAVRRATMTLAEAGVASAPVDALHLAAHLMGQDVRDVRRLMVLGGVDAPAGYDDLVAERATRIPLQHLTGRAYFRALELRVGPGVFVPRPETEMLVDLALRALAGRERPVVVDLATGSGAIALALKQEHPSGVVYAVELDELAHGWAVANRDRLALDVRIEQGDARKAYPELAGLVDLVTCNPPYIPDDQVAVDPEVRDHDPALALFGGGADGLALPLQLAASAARLLAPGGVLVMEHADTQGAALPLALSRTDSWGRIVDHPDLLGRPRAVVAVRAPERAGKPGVAGIRSAS